MLVWVALVKAQLVQEQEWAPLVLAQVRVLELVQVPQELELGLALERARIQVLELARVQVLVLAQLELV